MFNRRGLITGLISLVAAPTIVRIGSLMPIKSYDNDISMRLITDYYFLEEVQPIQWNMFFMGNNGILHRLSQTEAETYLDSLNDY